MITPAWDGGTASQEVKGSVNEFGRGIKGFSSAAGGIFWDDDEGDGPGGIRGAAVYEFNPYYTPPDA
jgi:hypothetical protein